MTNRHVMQIFYLELPRSYLRISQRRWIDCNDPTTYQGNINHLAARSHNKQHNSETAIHNLLIKRINLSSKVAQSTLYFSVCLLCCVTLSCRFAWVESIGLVGGTNGLYSNGMECVMPRIFLGWSVWQGGIVLRVFYMTSFVFINVSKCCF